MAKRRRVFSMRAELLAKSREAALSAVQIFNNPLTRFKSESFIVLMIIAWTYLLHACYRANKVEYRYFRQGAKRRRFDRTSRRAYKYWELRRCLDDDQSPVDKNTANNLKFLIGLRDEIEHQMTLKLDTYLSGRYHTCSLNYNHYVKKLFGEQHGLDAHLTYSLQFSQLAPEQIDAMTAEDIPQRVRAYIAAFDADLSKEEFNSPQYSYCLLFTRKLTGKVGQADQIVEFISPDSEVAQQIDRQYWVQKEVEKPKYQMKDIIAMMRKEGYVGFGPYQHTQLWRSMDAKNAAHGFGVPLGGQWFWYERWLDIVRRHCRESGRIYRQS